MYTLGRVVGESVDECLFNSLFPHVLFVVGIESQGDTTLAGLLFFQALPKQSGSVCGMHAHNGKGSARLSTVGCVCDSPTGVSVWGGLVSIGGGAGTESVEE